MNKALKTVTLFRPVGLLELGLIFDAGMKEFPPRLPEQPIFYPVLNQVYARQIAKEWNAEASPYAGYVTKFDLELDYVAKFPVKTVGASVHQELWVPAEQLQNFNSHIIGHIHAIEAFCSSNFIGFIPEKFGLAGNNATEQIVSLGATFGYSGMDFICETAANAKAIYLNYPFWITHNFSKVGLEDSKKQKVLKAIKQLWLERFPLISLCEGSV